MSVQDVVDEIAADGHAQRRLRDDVDVEIHVGENGILTAVEGESFAVAAYIDYEVDACRLHESFAATCYQALHELEQLARGEEP